MSGLKPPTYKYTAYPQVGSFSSDMARSGAGPVSGLKPPPYKYTANP